MKILVACEFSGTVRDAFIKRGHDAVSCDILDGEGDGPHIKGDVSRVIHGRSWDMIIAHPPCTYLCNSGVSWLHRDNSRWGKLKDAADFFNMFLDVPVMKLCVENPIMHKYAKELIGGRRQSQIIQPWMFGHPEQKATCLWLRGLPLLKPTNDVRDKMKSMTPAERQKLHWLPPSKDRWKLRSKTFQGIADAMAEQWG